MSSDTGTQSAHTATARRALEEVCSGKDLGGIPDVYHQDFVDHVNALEYRGHEGAHRSVALYLELFSDLRFVVDEQVSDRRPRCLALDPARHSSGATRDAPRDRDQPLRR